MKTIKKMFSVHTPPSSILHGELEAMFTPASTSREITSGVQVDIPKAPNNKSIFTLN
jgi:hypothetical protein